jgi:hypothetical protein
VQKTPDIWQIIGNAATFSCLQRMTLIDGRGERISIEESLLPSASTVHTISKLL